MDDYRYKALQMLTRARFYAVQDLTREKQRFANYLFLKCSGLAQDKDIINTSATTLALMEHFETADEAWQKILCKRISTKSRMAL